MMKVVVVIPVYNGFDESIECIESVIKNTDKSIPIIVVDDASPKGEFIDVVPESFKNIENLHLKRFKENGGYVKSVNFGMKYAERIVDIRKYKVSQNELGDVRGTYDCILLNSDTIVTRNWVQKMHAAAYSEDRIATVTPYSNNAVLVSFPRFCRPNKIAKENIETLNGQIEKYSKRHYPEITTSMGYCNYIRRSVIEGIGIYNEEAFGIGNGEENDFSMRAMKASYKNIIDDATYIYHIGEVSFAEKKDTFTERNGEILNEMHPEYAPMVANFCAHDPNRPIRNEVLDKILLEESEKTRVLHIVHNGPFFSRNIEKVGGTEIHVQDLIENVSGFQNFSLISFQDHYYLTAYTDVIEREFKIKKENTSLKDLINNKLFNIVHLHHTLNYDKYELIDALLEHGNYVVSAHDYNSICPRSILVTPESKVCTTVECSSACNFADNFISEYRGKHQKLIENASKLVCFSNDTLERLKDVFNSELTNGVVINHGVDLSKEKVKQESLSDKIKILIIGVLAPHKGLEIVKNLGKLLNENKELNLEVNFLGKIYSEENLEFLINHGEYERENLYSKVLEINPNFGLLTSICYETYSLTCDELLSLGVPLISGTKGAPKERITMHAAGWCLEDFSADSVIKLLKKLVIDEQEYTHKFKNAKSAQLMSKQDEAIECEKIYRELKCDSTISLVELVEKLRDSEGLKIINEESQVKSEVISISNKDNIKQIAKKIIPNKIYNQLKRVMNR